MSMTNIAFFYFMKPNIENLNELIDKHIFYWQKLNFAHYKGGPFGDKSGGLISFSVENFDQAVNIINGDPFVTNNCLDQKWIKQWLIK